MAWVDTYLGAYISKDDSVLDVGCSSGKASFALERFGARIVGVDCSPKSLHLAQSIAVDMGSTATFVQADYNNLPFPDAHFNVAVFPQNLVECSYSEMSYLLKSIRRVLRRGGHLLLTMKDAISRQKLPQRYNVHSGEVYGEVAVPQGGTYEYPTYFWTVAFAKYIISQYLKFIDCISMDREVYLLVFAKEWD